MTVRALLVVSVLMLVSSGCMAADEGRGGEIFGTWTVTGGSLHDRTYTLTVERDGATTVKSHVKTAAGESSSSSSGPRCVQANGKLKFQGESDVDGFKIGGTWGLTWEGPDAVTAKTENGDTYKLARVKEK